MAERDGREGEAFQRMRKYSGNTEESGGRDMKWIVRAAFGLEGLAAREMKRLGLKNVETMSVGGACFEGSMADAMRANLWIRTGDRVLLQMGRFRAETFDMLFEGVKALPWKEIFPHDAAFPVRAHCARSRLMSPSDCQKIVKKAVAQAMGGGWLPEDGSEYQIDVSIHSDVATVALDASGEALSRRGYRTWNGEAPLRESLAAALAMLARRGNEPLYDPCCGTGTILCEAAMIERDRAPGLFREFAMEKWTRIDPAIRQEAMDRYEAGRERPVDIAGSDIDGEAIELAKRHLHQARIGGVRLEARDLRDVRREGEGLFLCNPPYGERLGDAKSAAAVERALGEMARAHEGWRLCAFSGDPSFERNARMKAQKRRRLYNGRLECELMWF